METRREVARGMARQPGQRVLALQPFSADAPQAAADFAAALGIAHPGVIAEALNAVGRRFTQAHAMKRIGAPRFDDCVRPWRIDRRCRC